MERLAYIALALPEHRIEDVGDRDREELGAKLPRDRPRDVGLPAPGRPVEEQPASEALVVELAELRIAQREEETRLESLLDFGHAADVRKAQHRALGKQWAAVGVRLRFIDEGWTDDLGNLRLCTVPVKAIVGGCRGFRCATESLAHEFLYAGVAGLLAEGYAEMSRRILGQPLADEELCQVHAQFSVVRGRGNRTSQRVDQALSIPHSVQFMA